MGHGGFFALANRVLKSGDKAILNYDYGTSAIICIRIVPVYAGWVTIKDETTFALDAYEMVWHKPQANRCNST